jgi:hypothetical protein
MKLSHETLKAILVPIPPKKDRRNFLVRLLSSLKFGVKITRRIGRRGDVGKTGVSFRVGGGTDF